MARAASQLCYATPARTGAFREGRTAARAGTTREPSESYYLGRILLVPVIIWAITSGQMAVAFVLFFIAGVSDAVDGFLAKRFNMQSEIGALLDPLADKCLLVSIYIALGHYRRYSAMARHPGGVARHHHRRRGHRLVAGRPADPNEAADGVEAEHRGAGGLCRAGAGRARFRLRDCAVRYYPDGGRHGADAVVGRASISSNGFAT